MPKVDSRQTLFSFIERLDQSPSSRRGNATCRKRLEGWIQMVVARSRIWGRIDLEAFCRTTRYSREHATRTLSLIRKQSTDWAFETKICQRRKNGPKRWGVIVAERSKLRFDGHSLFFSDVGRWLHNYTSLGYGREKISPTLCQSAKMPSDGSYLPSMSKAAPAVNALIDSIYRRTKLPEPVRPRCSNRQRRDVRQSRFLRW